MEAEFSHADRQTDRHDEDNSRFAQFWQKWLKDLLLRLYPRNFKNGPQV